MGTNESAVYAQVVQAFCDALGLDEDEVEKTSLVIEDLGAESLDFLDIAFRLERSFGIKIPRGEIQKAAEQQAGEAFEVEGRLTASGARALREALPEADATQIIPGFPVRDIPRLFTVETFYHLVTKLLFEKERLAS
ncbi:MAG: phosphopantetheine-binding protein [Myxococcota bacterium]|nr:phosphopantetheine-binding protein [Myxococcota bacterium]